MTDSVRLITSVLLSLGLAACEDRPEPPPAPAAPPEAAAAEPPAEAPPTTAAALGERTVLSLSTVGDQMRFDKATLEAPAGEVAITFTNAATSASMQHNVVLVPAGKADAVGAAGIGAGPERGYVPDGPDVIAATKLLGPGQRDTLVATLAPGEYAFICTFPGHYLQMRGTLRVRAR